MGLKHLPAIDGLRAVAVLSVVAYHAGFPAGFVGVDVFFVISGYLITRLLMEDGRLVEFYARRARRILPAAFLCVVATLGLSFLLLPSAGDVARSAAAAGLFVANLFFQSATGDYWSADAASMPLLHLWSLSVEEQFYLAWPLLLWIASRNKPPAANENGVLLADKIRRIKRVDLFLRLQAFWKDRLNGVRLGRQGHVGEPPAEVVAGADDERLHAEVLRGVAGPDDSHLLPDVKSVQRLTLLVFFASLALYAWLSYADPNAAFYQTPARAWELAAGGLVALAHYAQPEFKVAAKESDAGVDHDAGGLVSARERELAVAEQQVGVAGQVVALVGNDDVPILHDDGGGFDGVLKSHSGLARLNGPDILRNLRTFVLQHGSHIGLAVIGLALLPWPVYVAQPLAVLGSVLVIASVHAGHRSILGAKPLVWIGLISYSLYLWHWPLLALDRATRVGETPMETRAALVAAAFVLAALSYRYVEQPFRRMRVRPARAVAIGVVCAAALATTAFSLAREPKPVIASSALSCSAPLKPARCVGKEPKVVLWGDSYAGAWEGVVQRMGKVAVGMVDTGCPPVIGIDVPRPTPRASRYCKERAARDLAWLQANGADTLLVTAHWARLLRERPDAGPGILAWAKGLPNVRRIIVIGATPEIRDSIGKCHGEECDIPRGEYEASAAATKAVMRELGKLPNVEVWEVGDWMCGTTCPAFRDGVALYQHDDHHISTSAADGYARLRQ